MFGLNRFNTKEWVVLVIALVVVLAFLPGTPAVAGLGRLLDTVYGVIPLALIGGAVYAFYRWWQADEAGLQTRPKACPSCGTETAESWKACPKCGNNLQRESVFCRFCGQPMLGGWTFCPACAHPVESTPAPAAENPAGGNPPSA